MSLFTPELGLIFWMLLAFLLVVFVLGKYGWPSITGMINERNNYITHSLESAEQANQRLADIKIEEKEIIEGAQRQQIQILKEAAQLKDEMIRVAAEEARQKADQIVAAAKISIENQKQEALRDIRSQVGKLSIEIAQRLLRRELATSKDQTALIDSILDEINATKS